MTHVDYRMGVLIALPFVLVFLAGIAAGIVAIFLICNLPLLRRTWDDGRTFSFALTASASLSVLVLIGSLFSGLILMYGLSGQDAYVPDSFPLFLLRPALEFFMVILAALVVALLVFGWLRNASELMQRAVVPLTFIAAFVLALSLTKAWSSYWVLTDTFDTDLFIGTLYEMVRGEVMAIAAAFTGFSLVIHGGSGIVGEVFSAIAAQADAIWAAVRAAGGNQFVLIEQFPAIFAVSSLIALVYMVLRWPLTAFHEPRDT